MATSGSKSVLVTAYNELTFTWVVTAQSLENNASTVSWNLMLGSKTQSGKIVSTASKDWSVVINGEQFSGTNTVGIAGEAVKQLAQGKAIIKHSSDGTKTFSYSFSQEFNITFSGSQIGTISGVGTGTLPTISRASQPTVPDSCSFGDEITINTNRASTSFTHIVRYEFGTQSGEIGRGVGASKKWVVPTSLMNEIPNSTSGIITVYLDTYNGSTKIGTKSCDLTALVPSSVAPTCTLSVTDPTGIKDTYGAYVKGLSKFYVVIAPTIAYSSPIKSYNTSANGTTYQAGVFTTDFLKTSGELTVSTTIADNRNRVKSATQTVTVLDYAAPKVSALSVHRCDEDDIEDENGEFIKVKFSASITPLDNKNTAQYKLRYKKSSLSTWTEITLSALTGLYTITDEVFSFEADTNSSYDIVIVAIDRHGQFERSSSGSTAFTIFDIHSSGTGVCFGGVAEEAGVVAFKIPIKIYHPIQGQGGDKVDLTLGSAFNPYSASAYPWCRKNAMGMVEFHGVIKPASGSNNLGNSTGETICTLPSGYRPGVGVNFLCHGDIKYEWLLSISTSGKVTASCYRSGSGMVTPPTSTWMPFHVTFFAD